MKNPNYLYNSRSSRMFYRGSLCNTKGYKFLNIERQGNYPIEVNYNYIQFMGSKEDSYSSKQIKLELQNVQHIQLVMKQAETIRHRHQHFLPFIYIKSNAPNETYVVHLDFNPKFDLKDIKEFFEINLPKNIVIWGFDTIITNQKLKSTEELYRSIKNDTLAMFCIIFLIFIFFMSF